MKICDLTQSYTETSGGIRTYIHEKRDFIDRETDDIHILVIPGETDEDSCFGRHKIYRIASPFIPGCEPYRALLSLDKVVAILKKEMPDIIELGCVYTLPWAAYMYRQKHRQLPIVGFYHTDFPNTYVEPVVSKALGPGSGKLARIFSARYAKMVYNRCDLTVAPSRIIERSLKRYGIGNVRLNPLGVDIELFRPERRDAAVRKRLGASDEDVIFIYAGRIDSEKRTDILVEAFLMLPPAIKAKLVLVGGGPMSEQFDTPGHRERGVILHPFVNGKTELAALLASADIYVTSGPYETFGLSVIEAQACGLPVVGVNAGALPERVHETTGILAEMNNPRHMAECMLKLAGSDFRGKGKNARAAVVELYSWQNTFERMYCIYNSLLH